MYIYFYLLSIYVLYISIYIYIFLYIRNFRYTALAIITSILSVLTWGPRLKISSQAPHKNRAPVMRIPM